MQNKRVIIGLGIMACVAFSAILFFKSSINPRDLDDEALLSIIKNDQTAFEVFIANGKKLDTNIKVEGISYMVGELLVKYERVGFIKYAIKKKLDFVVDPQKDFDVHSLAVTQNNPEILSLLIEIKPNLAAKKYGAKKWSLLHMASAQCSHKVISLLEQARMKWNMKSQDGSTPLTIAAEQGCLQALSYWKEQGADFKAKDGRGLTALSILRNKKDAALLAFGNSFIKRMPASIVTTITAPAILIVPNFYNKRKIPQDDLSYRAHLIEPETRPDEAYETAENSEFSD